MYEWNIITIYFLGDSEYVAEPYMLTPMLNAVRDSLEDNYIKNHCSIYWIELNIVLVSWKPGKLFF